MLIEFAKDIAYAAGRVLRDTLVEGLSVEHKGEIDLVTDADRAAEALIVEAIQHQFPDHKILAEEEGAVGPASSTSQWVVDPLDGTTNFAHRFPYFSVSTAFLQDDELLLGVVYDPMADEMYTAVRGEGAWLNDHPIAVSYTDTLQRSLLATGFPYNVASTDRDNVEEYRHLVRRTQGVLRLGSAALDLCQVAAGRLDGFWEFELKPWDTAAGALIVQEAGGTVTTLDGKTFSIESGEVLASNGRLHDPLIQALEASRHGEC